MEILHIYGALSISLLFNDNQDTESEQLEMEIGLSGPILTQKKNQQLYWKTVYILYKMGDCFGKFSYLWS